MKQFGLGHKEYISKHDMQGIFLLFLACCCFLSGMQACTDDQSGMNRQTTGTACTMPGYILIRILTS